jgi:5S rRNA maturation endonuclease (ribonuclease M5)
MTGSELRLYVCILSLDNHYDSHEFKSTGAELRKLSGLGPATLPKALDGLCQRGLIQVLGDIKGYDVHVCDPFTGEPIHRQTGVDQDDPANYYVKGDKGQARRLNLNSKDPEQVKNLLRDCLQGATVTEQSNGDWMIRCPFHSDENPSCSVSPSKNGCFHCFGCGKNGSLADLFMQLKGIPKSEAIQQMAAGSGTTIEYHQPDSDAIAIYSYRNAKEKLIKQVLRYPNDEGGKKVFRQRQPAKGGDWKWSTTGLPPMLFNSDPLEFKYAGVACVTEGEKDACTVNALHLIGPHGSVIATTSGGAESWDAELAKELRGKRVVLMPDSDEPGKKYAADVKASLEAEDIEYRVVTFDNVGQKDVTDFLKAGHSVQELAWRIGPDWVDVPGEEQVESGPYLAQEIVRL